MSNRRGPQIESREQELARQRLWIWWCSGICNVLKKSLDKMLLVSGVFCSKTPSVVPVRRLCQKMTMFTKQ